jgi:hypothetical protein
MSVLFSLSQYECQYFIHQWLYIKDIVKLDVSTACSSTLKSCSFNHDMTCRSWKYQYCKTEENSEISVMLLEWMYERGIILGGTIEDRLKLISFNIRKLKESFSRSEIA